MTQDCKRQSKTLIALAIFGIILVLFISCFIHPDTNSGQDAALYLDTMHGFMEHGLALPYPREPLFPLFLVLIKTLGLTPEKHLPFIQNAMYIAALWFFLRSLLYEILSRAEALLMAVGITAIPTFMILVNGSFYTESLTTVLILLMLGTFMRMWRVLAETGGVAKIRALGWLSAAFVLSFMTGLLKGSFAFIHYFFAALCVVWIVWKFRKRHVRGQMDSAETRPRRLTLLLIFLWLGLVASGSKIGTELWLSLQRKNGAVVEVYERGGVAFYGRTEYVKHFNFSTQSAPYLANALSEKFGQRIYGAEARKCSFQEENDVGYRKRMQSGLSDGALFKLGIQNVFAAPIRQCFFCLFELSRFFFHHGTTGFAVLEFPIAGRLCHSLFMALALRFFNLALYAMIPLCLFNAKMRGRTLHGLWLSLPESVRMGTTLYVLYAIAYLAAYGFATTVVRMAYPVAPFLIILDLQVLYTVKKTAVSC